MKLIKEVKKSITFKQAIICAFLCIGLGLLLFFAICSNPDMVISDDDIEINKDVDLTQENILIMKDLNYFCKTFKIE